MADTRVTERPELGELEPGQKVMVRRSSNDSLGRKPEDRYIPALVVKASRVWVDLKSVDTRIAHDGRIYPERTWRMRRDTQDEGNRTYSQLNASFATLDQHAWDQTRAWAFEVLKEHGVRIERDSRWYDREVQLADILTKEDRT